MKRSVAILLVLCALSGACLGADDEVEKLPVDPVALVNGLEVPGNDAMSIDRGGYRYVFDNLENKKTFEQDPEKYEIQLGGACARMGPLTGRARIDLYGVHDGKIYLFASPGCRAGFLAHADQLLESDDPVPEFTPEAAARGRELIDMAVRALGGAEKLDSMTSYRDYVKRTLQDGGQRYEEART
ncbi:MAG: hypothetical protein ACREJC_06585, partial [Tepidisphaeraceae bacterium]